MNYEEIYPSIVVYKNVVEDIDELYDLVVKSETQFKGDFIFEEWIQWFVFGTYVSVDKHADPGFLSACHENINLDEWQQKELYIYDQISNATKKCIDHYASMKQVSFPDGSFITRPNIAKYIRLEWLDDDRPDSWGNLAMQFHTDYEMGKWFTKSRQFLLTANLYINDDYDGGEIIFLHDAEFIHYKPSKGDLIVFPSGSPLYPEKPLRNPYFHGVNVVRSGEKYFTRSYVQYETDYDEYWYNLKKSFDSEDDFNEKLESIYKSGGNTVGIYAGNGPQEGGSPFYEVKPENKDVDKFWISASYVVDKLYDVNNENIYFRNIDGWHYKKGDRDTIVDHGYWQEILEYLRLIGELDED